jgi:hypothetical protein
MIGWGEGLDQAARYLNTQPKAASSHAVSWYGPGCLSYFFEGRTTEIPVAGFADMDLQVALNADYIVSYATHEAQRGTTKDLSNYLDRQHPEHTVRIGGIEYVRIYAMEDAICEPSEYEVAGVALRDEIELEGYCVSDREIKAGKTLAVSLFWRVLKAPDEPLKVFVQMLDSTGKLVAQHDGEPVAWSRPTDKWRTGDQYVDRHGVLLPADLAPGQYKLLVGMYRYSGERLEIEQHEARVGDAFGLGTLTILIPPADSRSLNQVDRP